MSGMIGSAMLMVSASIPSTTMTGSGLMWTPSSTRTGSGLIMASSLAPGVGSNCSTVTESELVSTGVLSWKGRPAGPTGLLGIT
ncbi:unnamed protein product [Leptidea sinapis]|uniref:Uncharacterized protein n=1 Tax=Leptidea sinapis TaxID=189913 RepID=A0A5E4QEH0_9NEOP|nr:unnamed protein product [Leptidea sinapis]